ncbi:Starch-binding associating with outer membrane [Saccharicrinis carchari]|uniref:Starch-binding associating with outer membrane n=1 Tax=Saccharicrinis carchari TaxID=1168039 RepID=A0A521ACH8_SACCC|nr:RagB/SusD family nutrient uptake outer membrane protein [Saccharicrinis carchari]SMO32486.1 Starch-binding associating with outer membrane [Saccharicrinis carchari]
MKINIKSTWILLCMSILLLASCNDELDTRPLDKFSGDVVWSDAITARAFVNEAYGILGHMIQDDAWSDNMVLNPSQSGASNMVQEKISNENNFGWNIYSDIRKCNLILEKVAESNFSEADKDVMMGEAYFLRAVTNFTAARKFGRIIIVEEVLNPEDDLLLSRTASIKDTYDFIANDLQMAADLLPTQVATGRIGKGAAYALLAEVALHGAAYLDNSADKDAYYQTGKTASENLFALGIYALDSDYKGMFNTFEGGSGSPEIILAQYRLSTNTQMSNTWMQFLVPNFGGDKAAEGVLERWPLDKPLEGWLEKTPPQQLVDAYLVNDADGESKPWNQTSYFQAFVPHVSSVQDAMYKNRDKRFYASIVQDSSMMYTSLLTTRIGGNVHYASNVQQDRHMTKSGYVFRKAIYEAQWLYYNVPTDYHYTILRLGRAYLNYAELLMRIDANANMETAIEYINMTRVEHGGLSPLSTSISIDELWDAYKIERRVDLLQENDRYWSLLRWGKEDNLSVIPELSEIPTAISIGEDGKTFEIIPVPVVAGANDRNFTSRRYLLPLPKSETNENPNINQNPGWE